MSNSKSGFSNRCRLAIFWNNQILTNYLSNNGYFDLQQITFPGSTARMSTASTFLEPKFLIPVNIFIYRNGANDPNSAISESQARDIVCTVNTLYRETNSSIQFYVNRVEIEANETYNNQISSAYTAWAMWATKFRTCLS